MIVAEARGISKRYGRTLALDRVDFAVHSHAVNVLIGENGAGKSTLMRILAGVEQPTDGTLLLGGEPVSFGSVREAAARGIGMVYQELNLCPNLTVTENIMLGRDRIGRGGTIDRAAERETARALLARLEHAIDPDALVGTLVVGQQQIVEIAKALADDARILIMDEPTSALSQAEVEVLFRVIDDLRRQGVAIVYISHRLEELIRIGDFITVLRDGRLIETAPVAEVGVPWIVERMLGGQGRLDRQAGTGTPGDIVLEVEGLSVERQPGILAVDSVSARFRAGEVTAVYGLLGAGRTELFEAICGARPAAGGHVRLGGEAIDDLDLPRRVEGGLVLVPEDRQRDGLFANLDVGENIALIELPRLLRRGAISKGREASAVRGMMQRLGVKAASPTLPIGALSGGNQQKVVIGRCLMARPRAILLDEPSRGVDVGARADLFRVMRALAEEGLAVVFATSDLAEAQAIADRVIVMAAGRLTADMAAADVDEVALVRASNAIAASEAHHAPA